MADRPNPFRAALEMARLLRDHATAISVAAQSADPERVKATLAEVSLALSQLIARTPPTSSDRKP